MQSGPERDLVDDYMNRAAMLARGTGFLSVREDCVDVRKLSSRRDITKAMLDGVPDGAIIVILDERGKASSSKTISKSLARWRDDGFQTLVFLIGAADGFDQGLLPRGAVKWALGPQTWPHKLVRVMIAEQIYRGLSILAGTPYHRE